MEGCRGKDGAGIVGVAQEKNSRSPSVPELHRHLLNTNNDKHSRLTELPELSSKGFACGGLPKECFQRPLGVFIQLSSSHFQVLVSLKKMSMCVYVCVCDSLGLAGKRACLDHAMFQEKSPRAEPTLGFHFPNNTG